jgi:lipid II:glycine glycyltransferase (peptidoglycan interpeptide bridge formation enzyme)
MVEVRAQTARRPNPEEACLGPAGEEWDRCLLAADGHLLQSSRWGELKRSYGWDVQRIKLADGQDTAMAQVLFRRKGPVSVAYIPRGPAMWGNTESVFPALIDAIDGVCRQRRSLALFIEPDRPLGLSGTYRSVGFVRGGEPWQPTRTVKVPLLADEELMAQMHQKHRYNVRLAIRRGVTVEAVDPDDEAMETFFGLLKDTAVRNGFGVHERSYYSRFMELFGNDAVMLFAKANGSVAAVGISARFGNEALYMYGASSTEHRADGAAFLLQYEAMRWARDRGAIRYDLWGIPSEDPVIEKGKPNQVSRTQGEDWRGLFTFKVRFGGEIFSYPPVMERRYHPFLLAAGRRIGALGSS